MIVNIVHIIIIVVVIIMIVNIVHIIIIVVVIITDLIIVIVIILILILIIMLMLELSPGEVPGTVPAGLTREDRLVGLEREREEDLESPTEGDGSHEVIDLLVPHVVTEDEERVLYPSGERERLYEMTEIAPPLVDLDNDHHRLLGDGSELVQVVDLLLSVRLKDLLQDLDRVRVKFCGHCGAISLEPEIGRRRGSRVCEEYHEDEEDHTGLDYHSRSHSHLMSETCNVTWPLNRLHKY